MERYILSFIVVACLGLFTATVAKVSMPVESQAMYAQKSTTIVKKMKKLGFYCWKCDVRIKNDVGKLKNVIKAYVTGNFKLVIIADGPVDMKAVKKIIEREAYRFI